MKNLQTFNEMCKDAKLINEGVKNNSEIKLLKKNFGNKGSVLSITLNDYNTADCIMDILDLQYNKYIKTKKGFVGLVNKGDFGVLTFTTHVEDMERAIGDIIHTD